MPKIRTVSAANTRYQLIEDPNPSYNRIFFDGQALDLNTLVPQWQKQFMYNIQGLNNYAGLNINNGIYNEVQNMLSRSGSLIANGFTEYLPVLDYSWHHIGYLALQKGTISTYSVGDGNAVPGSGSGGSGTSTARQTSNGQYDTYWWSLDQNYIPTKGWKSVTTGYVHMIFYPDAIYADYGANRTSFGWGTWLPDISQGINNTSNNSALFYNSHDRNPNIFVYEDTMFNVMYGIKKQGGVQQKATATQNFNYGNTYSSTTYVVDTTTSAGPIFFMGVDALGFTYWVWQQDNIATEPVYIYKIDPRNLAQTTVISSLTSQATQNYAWLRNYPSNIRKDANNRYVFYTSHYDYNSSMLQPMRVILDAANGTVNTANCNMIYNTPATNYRTYAAVMSLPWPDQSGLNSHNHMMKPHQFTSNGNTYITFWLVDQNAYPAVTTALSSTLQTYYSSNGNIRWANTAQRTMMTYQIAANSGYGNINANTDVNLTYHSSYTFNTLLDMPKNFMPINANNTLMAVCSTGKTNFFAWNNNTGWASGGVYNTEFRMLGLDNTNRIWGYAMDENNGSIHVLTPSLSVNVVIQMAATSYTYTGTTISTSAAINAYDYTGSRVTANVTLTIDGTTMTFAQNGLRTLNIQTSSTVDTTVNLSIFGGGVNNIYAYA